MLWPTLTFFLSLVCRYVVCCPLAVVISLCAFLIGEQPPSSMSPAILYSKSKKHTMVVGGSGGSMIITGMALVSTPLTLPYYRCMVRLT